MEGLQSVTKVASVAYFRYWSCRRDRLTMLAVLPPRRKTDRNDIDSDEDNPYGVRVKARC